jgi:hypothetical protein
MFVTMTTVGYGDFSPKSDGGKVVAMFATLAGLINIALPLAIVGENFIEGWQNRLLEFVLGRICDQLHVRKLNDCVHAFEAFDPRGDGWIDWLKFKRGVRRHLHLRCRMSELYSVWEQIDKGGTGQVSLIEFCELFFPDDEQGVSDLVKALHTMKNAKPKMQRSCGSLQNFLGTQPKLTEEPSQPELAEAIAEETPGAAGVAPLDPARHAAMPAGVDARLGAIEAALRELTTAIRALQGGGCSDGRVEASRSPETAAAASAQPPATRVSTATERDKVMDGLLNRLQHDGGTAAAAGSHERRPLATSAARTVAHARQTPSASTPSYLWSSATECAPCAVTQAMQPGESRKSREGLGLRDIEPAAAECAPAVEASASAVPAVDSGEDGREAALSVDTEEAPTQRLSLHGTI